MARCDSCGSTILFGGVSDGEWRFCNAQCHQGGFLLHAASQIPEELLTQEVQKVHQGECPKCGGPGPVDLHVWHTVWSAIAVTRWGSKSAISCQSCGTKSKLGGTAFSMALGWWGFPWGLIMTPIQISRNIVGLIKSPDPATPSDQLVKMVKIHLASHLTRASQQPVNPG